MSLHFGPQSEQAVSILLSPGMLHFDTPWGGYEHEGEPALRSPSPLLLPGQAETLGGEYIWDIRFLLMNEFPIAGILFSHILSRLSW